MQHKAQGKFLLTGEYLVLKGAKSLAIPLKYGQTMQVNPSSVDKCEWTSFQNGQAWFHAIFNEKLELIESNNAEVAQKLIDILQNIFEQNPSAKELFVGKAFTFDTDFPRDWGLGTSSTLIALLANYTKTNPYKILEASFGGSGYDLACAFADGPIFYTKNEHEPIIEKAHFEPNFAHKLYVVYLGQKQNSSQEVKKFFKEAIINETDIKEISNLADTFCQASDIKEFIKAMQAHEQIMSRLLKTQPVQEKYFSDFDGAVKSMGAWGGDFVLVASDREDSYVKNYFLEKNFVTILGYSNVL